MVGCRNDQMGEREHPAATESLFRIIPWKSSDLVIKTELSDCIKFFKKNFTKQRKKACNPIDVMLL